MMATGKELDSLANIRLIDITSSRLVTWAKSESYRPARARLALRLLQAFLFWCMGNDDAYNQIITSNAAQSKPVREILGKPIVRSGVLQKQQLSAWFKAVRELPNPVISAYLQALVLTGERREELIRLRWDAVDFQWGSLTIRDRIDGQRVIP